MPDQDSRHGPVCEERVLFERWLELARLHRGHYSTAAEYPEYGERARNQVFSITAASAEPLGSAQYEDTDEYAPEFAEAVDQHPNSRHFLHSDLRDFRPSDVARTHSL